MPTGYTAGILDGKIKTLPEFAKVCMRAFGACIHMKEEDIRVPYTPAIPSDYHLRAIEVLEKDMTELKATSEEQLVEQKKIELQKDLKRYEKTLKETKEKHKLLQSLLSDIKKWKPPTRGHYHFKNFMKEQLESTIKWDADIEYYEDRIKSIKIELIDINPKVLYEERLKMYIHDIKYHTSENKREIKRCNDRNKWVAILLKSLDEQDGSGSRMGQNLSSQETTV